MKQLISNWRIVLFILALFFSFFLINFQGPDYGIEFTGGTYFTIKLEEKVSPDDMARVTSLISNRVDKFGLKDSRVNSLGPDLVGVQIAETDPKNVAEIESILKTQAKFEAMLDGNVLFAGSDIKQISKDPATGYGLLKVQGGYEWRLPFTLSQQAAENFSKKIFHKCTPTGYDPNSGSTYDCEDTYFFIDRPFDGIIIITQSVFSSDSALMAEGNPSENIPKEQSVDLLLQNSGVPYFIIPDSNTFAGSQIEEIKELATKKKKAVVHPSISPEIKKKLAEFGYKIVEPVDEKDKVPWVWTALGARQIIALTPEITGFEPYIENVKDARINAQIYIRGFSETSEGAEKELKELNILLETGSLPIGIESISKETISPTLGQEFLKTSFLIGIVAIISVALLIFLRYKKPYLALPIIFIGISEVIITVGVAILIKVRFDLSSVTGIIAAVGTGLNDQIVILDELLKGGTATSEITYTNRIKKAFFIVVAAAMTTGAALFPLIIFSSQGFGKLAGFAITEMLGILVGVLISRPAFSVVAEHILKTRK
jgi:preprotein translocase subunit SecD